MINFILTDSDIKNIVAEHLYERFDSCEECGGLFRRDFLHEVTLDYTTRFYCRAHRPPYDVIASSFDPIRYYRHQVRVNRDGSIYKEPKSNKLNEKRTKHWTEMIFE